MGTTAKRALRYPEPTDRVADGATAIKNLAIDTDTQLPNRGNFTGNTDASGDVLIPHGLGVIPTGVSLTGADANSRLYLVVATTATNIQVRCRTSTTGAALAAGTTVNIYWLATR